MTYMLQYTHFRFNDVRGSTILTGYHIDTPVTNLVLLNNMYIQTPWGEGTNAKRSVNIKNRQIT